MDRSGIKQGVKECISALFEEFTQEPHAFYKENTVHCHMYHLLTEAGLNESFPTKTGYTMRQVQKEYPPILAEETGRRGRFDLVVFDESEIGSVNDWDHRQDGKPVGPATAIEFGLNKGFVNDPGRVDLADIDKELRRTSATANRVGFGVVIYLYRYATYQVEPMKAILQVLEEKATALENAAISIIAVAFDVERDYTPMAHLRLEIEDGKVKSRKGSLFEAETSYA